MGFNGFPRAIQGRIYVADGCGRGGDIPWRCSSSWAKNNSSRGHEEPINATIYNEEALRAYRDKNAPKLATQLESINYPATVTFESDTLHIRVGQASIRDVRRAICRQRGWPSSEGKMVRMIETLRLLHQTGITKVKIIGDTETLDVELGQDGRCKKAS